MIQRLRMINKNQRGFTLIELLVVIAITAVISGGISTGIVQVINGNTRSSNHMTAVGQVQVAGYWVSHDSQMAQSSSVNASAANGFPLTLSWVDWESGSDCEIVYSLHDTPGSSLKRLLRLYSSVKGMATGMPPACHTASKYPRFR